MFPATTCRNVYNILGPGLEVLHTVFSHVIHNSVRYHNHFTKDATKAMRCHTAKKIKRLKELKLSMRSLCIQLYSRGGQAVLGEWKGQMDL